MPAELIEASELVDMADIADRLGVKPGTVDVWTRRHADTFPGPLRRFGGSPVWRWADVAQWAQETGRL